MAKVQSKKQKQTGAENTIRNRFEDPGGVNSTSTTSHGAHRSTLASLDSEEVDSLFGNERGSPQGDEEALQAAREEDLHNARNNDTSLYELRVKQHIARKQSLRQERQATRDARAQRRDSLRDAALAQHVPAVIQPLEDVKKIEDVKKVEMDSQVPVTPQRRTSFTRPMSDPRHNRLDPQPMTQAERLLLDRKREGEYLHVRSLFQFLHVSKKREAMLESAKRELEEEMQMLQGEVGWMEGRKKRRM